MVCPVTTTSQMLAKLHSLWYDSAFFIIIWSPRYDEAVTVLSESTVIVTSSSIKVRWNVIYIANTKRAMPQLCMIVVGV